MISLVSSLLKGKSTLEVSEGNPDKLKSVKKIQAVLHLIRIVLILLGITLTILGATGVLGVPGLVAGGVLLLLAFCLIMPLFIKRTTRQTIVHDSLVKETPSIVIVNEALFKQIWNELVEILRQWEKEALNDPRINDLLIDCRKYAEAAVGVCQVEKLSEDFYLPLLFWSIADRKPEPLKVMDSGSLMIKASYLIIVQGLKNFKKLTKICKQGIRSRQEFQAVREMVGDSFSDGSIALTSSVRNSGVQVIRAGLNCLYRAYLSLWKSVGNGPFMTPETPYYELRALYNDALAQCSKTFSVEELKNLNSIKNEGYTGLTRECEMMNGDFIIQMLTHPHNDGSFGELQLLNSILGRGSRYDLVFG